MADCSICYVKVAAYTIQCNSTVPHQLCHECESSWRLKSKPTIHGRLLTCPFCRKEETEPGLRSHDSYKAELHLLYQQLYGRSGRERERERDRLEIARERRERLAREQSELYTLLRQEAAARAAAEVRVAADVRARGVARIAAVASVRPPSPPYVPAAPAAAPPAAPAAAAPPAAPAPAAAPAASRTRMWCKNKSIVCTTRSLTPRICTYPGGCTEHVCRSCKMCRSHFQLGIVAGRIEIYD